MQVKWLRKALINLEDEINYIARDNPQAAKSIAQKIWDASKLLAENPSMGRAGRVPGTRELIIPDTDYLLPYRANPKENSIEILRVVHCSRKPPKNW